jgi:hypothetical protein
LAWRASFSGIGIFTKYNIANKRTITPFLDGFNLEQTADTASPTSEEGTN